MASVETAAAVPSPPVVPTTLVVRYGVLATIAELPYRGEHRPMCGDKVVLRTRRGTELGVVLMTTCEGTSCPLTVPRQRMVEYINQSGGEDFPFTSEGQILRIATKQDLIEQEHISNGRAEYLVACRQDIAELQLPMRLIDVELLLGGEMVTFYFSSEERVDFRALVKLLAARFHTRIQLHQVGARDEARLAADFETCGQHCCCKQFLKLLRPVNMSAARLQKATLDPSKVSGRCGRLKCCLRFEEQTYDELRRKLPRVGSRVRTDEGVGTVVDTMILTQLVKVRLDEEKLIAVPNEELLERDLPEGGGIVRPVESAPSAADPGRPPVDTPDNDAGPGGRGAGRRRRRRRGGPPANDE